MKALKKIFVFIVCVIAILGAVVVGGYIFIRSRYGIDLFRTAGQLKKLNETINESELCPNAFEESDFAELTELNKKLGEGFITHTDGKGYNGYEVNFSATPSEPTTIAGITEIKISEKQAGALGQIMFFKETGGKITIANKNLTTTIKQIDFSNIESGNADLNMVVEIDLTPLTEEMSSFPYSLFKKYVPSKLYISSTVRIEKTAEMMGYTVAHKEFKINNLSADDTEDLFHTLDAVIKIGSAESLNLTIGEAVAQALIGNSENSGFAYSLRAIFNTFNFKAIEAVDYFVVERV